MKTKIFARRCLAEMLRDPLTLIFGVGFPVILLLLLSVMNLNIPAEAQMSIFEIESLMPGVTVFGFSFLALFTGLMVSSDRETAFLTRLYTSPLRARDFILGYALPLFPIGIAQVLVCIAVAFPFGLGISMQLLVMVAALLPSLILFVGIGLLVGSCMTNKQVGSVCGALLTNLSAWLSGTWFSLDLLGKGFKTFAFCLPFANAVEAARYALAGDVTALWKPIAIVSLYAVLVCVASVAVFRKKMKG